MADLPSHPDTDDAGARHGREPTTTRPPRWVSVVATIVAVAVVMLLVALHLTGVLGPSAH
jgi:hypothetical protein